MVEPPAPSDGMRAVVSLPLDTVDGATAKLLWFSAFLGVIVAVGVALLGNAAVRLGLRPLFRVEATAQKITDGDLNLRVPDTVPATEVGRLGQALNTMLDRLRTALHHTAASERQMRRFMADAGHELRTPLTAIQGFAELLHDAPRMPAVRRTEAARAVPTWQVTMPAKVAVVAVTYAWCKTLPVPVASPGCQPARHST